MIVLCRDNDYDCAVMSMTGPSGSCSLVGRLAHTAAGRGMGDLAGARACVISPCLLLSRDITASALSLSTPS